MRKIYIILTTILYITISFILVFALSLNTAAAELRIPFIAVDSITSPWTADIGLTLAQTPDNDQSASYIFNPFKPMRIIDPSGSGSSVGTVTPVTETFDSYGYATFEGMLTNNVSYITISTDFIGQVGAINSINLQLCVPIIADETQLLENSSYAMRTNGIVYSPSQVTFSKSLPYYLYSIYQGPVDEYAFYIYNILVYYDEVIPVSESSYFSVSIPISGFEWTMDIASTNGCVFGINDLIVDYFPSFDAAQNDIIINNLEKFPQRYKYDDTIDGNESLSDQFSLAGDFENSLYDNVSIADGLDTQTAANVSMVFSKLNFIYTDWAISLILTGIGLALLSYALFGGT